MEEQKFCINCKHFKSLDVIEGYTCVSPQNTYTFDVVYGTKKRISCSSNRHFTGQCGPDGKFYELADDKPMSLWEVFLEFIKGPWLL